MNRFVILLLAIFTLCSGAVMAFAAESETSFYTVTHKEAEAAVALALEEQTEGATHYSATLIGNRTSAIYQSDAPLTVKVKTLRLDKEAKKWEANLLILAKGEVVTALPAHGRYEEMVDVPVLKDRIFSDHMITPEDIEMTRIPVSRQRRDMVMDKNDLIGKSPKRAISASRPVRGDELGGLKIVTKDSAVKMIYAAPGLNIQTMGQALEAGGEGDTVRVRNLDSKAVVRGVVSAKGEVRIVSPMSDGVAAPAAGVAMDAHREAASPPANGNAPANDDSAFNAIIDGAPDHNKGDMQ